MRIERDHRKDVVRASRAVEAPRGTEKFPSLRPKLTRAAVPPTGEGTLSSEGSSSPPEPAHTAPASPWAMTPAVAVVRGWVPEPELTAPLEPRPDAIDAEDLATAGGAASGDPG